jgi:DNA-nicking Smr family endonuclease
MTGGRRGSRKVTPDERKLWKTVAKDFVPLDRSTLEPDDEPPVVEAAPAQPSRPAPRTQPAPKTTGPANTPVLAKTPTLAEFEARRAKRLAAGRIAIEAKLDLHGMRQDEAREALMRFLRAAQASGLRHVKVITGKGAPERDEHRPFSMFEENRRGVLRDQVPRWLGDSSARALVVSFTEAGRGHGGSGALYIQIRKKSGRPG